MARAAEHRVLHDQRPHRVHAVDLTSGSERFVFDGIEANGGVEMELLRDGGVAWLGETAIGNPMIGAIDGNGQELFQCPLSTTIESQTVITRGRAFVQTANSIVAYDVPGLEIEPSGWVSDRGSLGRGGRAQ